MTSPLERRTYNEGVELREEGNALTAIGYGSVFNSYSQNLGGFVERVDPAAFNKALGDQQDVRALFNHDPNKVLGRSKSGTLRMSVDDVGLRYEIDLPNTPTGQELAELLKRGDISGSSFGFRAMDEEWSLTDDGFPLRTLKSVALRDVGPVVFPAYSDAGAALRSLAEERSLDLNVLIEAAEHNELRSALEVSNEAEEGSAGDTDEEREDDSENHIVLAHARRFSYIR